MADIGQIWDALCGEDSFLISTHLHPDADGISSELALASILRWCGKRCKIINESPLPGVYRFLPGIEQIQSFNGNSVGAFDCLIALDCGRKCRLGPSIGEIPVERVANIDHHISNDYFGDLNWVDPEASSTAELVLELADHAGMPIDVDRATCLYTGILTDTANFCSASTQPRTLEIAARLIGHGASPQQVSGHLYRCRSLGKLHLQGMLINTLEVSEGGRVAWAQLTQAMCKQNGVPTTETHDFVTLPLSIGGVELGILFRELGEGQGIKVSFRSEGSADISRLARGFGGGGHPTASGCTLETSIDRAVEHVVPEVIEQIEGIPAGLG